MGKTNIGALTSGVLKISVAAGVATPATATPGTDYLPIPIQSTSLTPAVGTAGAKVYVVKTITSDASGVFGVPTGTPVEGQVIDYLLINDGNGAWTLDMATAACFQAIGVVLPTITVVSKITAVGVRWNASRSKWLVYAVSQEQ